MLEIGIIFVILGVITVIFLIRDELRKMNEREK